ncbi:general substrate transporter [Xylariaceae sp. FL0016]|nr:general substrate transporter [Xylariaceae sp. FL0016]
MAISDERNTGLKANVRCLVICMGMALASAQMGFDGVVSSFQAMPGFLMVFGYRDPSLKEGWGIRPKDQQLIASFLSVGTMIGSALLAPFGRYFGRRQGIWMGTLIGFASCTLQLAAETLPMLCLGRVMLGASNAFFITFSKAYVQYAIVECAPPRLRAFCTAFLSVMVSIGAIAAAVTVQQTSQLMNKHSYQIPLSCMFLFPTILSILMFFIPESPRWLLLHDRPKEAEQALATLRGHSLAPEFFQEELVEIIRGVEQEKAAASSTSLIDIFKGTNLRRTLICLMVTLSHASSGMFVFISYGTYFFMQAGVKDPFRIQIYGMCVSCIGVAAGMFCAYKVWGRRKMILFGTAAATLSMFAPALADTIAPKTPASAKVFLAFSFMNMVAYGGFAGTVIWPISAEVISSRLRIMTLSFAYVLDELFAWTTAFCTPYFINPSALNWGVKYCWIFAASNLITFIAFWLFLPDMQGRSLEEIDELFEKRVATRDFPRFECQSSTQAHDIAVHTIEETKGSVQHVEYIEKSI